LVNQNCRKAGSRGPNDTGRRTGNRAAGCFDALAIWHVSAAMIPTPHSAADHDAILSIGQPAQGKGTISYISTSLSTSTGVFCM
jgi:hypothetical protein